MAIFLYNSFFPSGFAAIVDEKYPKNGKAPVFVFFISFAQHQFVIPSKNSAESAFYLAETAKNE